MSDEKKSTTTTKKPDDGAKKETPEKATYASPFEESQAKGYFGEKPDRERNDGK